VPSNINYGQFEGYFFKILAIFSKVWPFSCVQNTSGFLCFYRFHFKPDFVLVAERFNELEVPLDPVDNTLGLQTLKRAFPGAHGLKYKNPATGAMRALL